MKRPHVNPAGLVPGWLATAACLAALALAWVEGAAQAESAAPSPSPSAAPAASAVASAAPAAGGSATPAAAQPAAAPPAAASAMGPGPGHGTAPLFGGGMVPLKWMPPGTSASPLPSDEIFPPQQITIRFNHKLHIKKFGQTCKVCHAVAYQSDTAKDRLFPDPTKTCDNCHDVDHSRRQGGKVVGGTREDNGKCNYCHLGSGVTATGGEIAPVVVPTPNIRNSHKKHLARNIQCAQCHGQIEELELATREQMPRMAGCFTCHAMSGAAQGKAKGACQNCHLSDPSGRLATEFSSGRLQPPPWLHGAEHTPDWIARHKGVAGANSQLCASCHSSHWCADCHDGRVRPRKVHPNDWISMHAQAGRQDNPRCVNCHQLQTFCADCHRRVGVARDTGSNNRLSGRRFHPPPRIWTTAPRSSQHHAWEAQRNINACVACHTERDCATCHASKGVRGGGGVNPHPAGFSSRCRTPMRRNPRPCFVCHHPNDSVLATCQ